MEKVNFNNWLDFGIYPVKSETYTEFLCFRFNAYTYNYDTMIVKGKYVNNPFCDEIGIVYKVNKRMHIMEAFVPEEHILAWKNG